MSHIQEISTKERFKTYLKKIGSGEHTSKNLSRKESADALKLILTNQASPAQIGAFLIAHRIKRPEPQELAGMVDTYVELGPSLTSGTNQRRPICFGMPFDGRNRYAPIYPLTTLILLSAGQPVVLQGGKKMPVKYGITTEELFRAIGLNLTGLNMENVKENFIQTGFAFIYQPDHFQLAENLIIYREEIGKRPPLASMELIWTAHKNKHLLISGFVHTPTERRHWKTLKLLGEVDIITVKGLEGSIDFSTKTRSIATHIQNNTEKKIIINPIDYKYKNDDYPLNSLTEWQKQALEALNNQGPLKKSLCWNAGMYLWLSGITDSLENGLNKACTILESGLARNTLEKLINWRKSIDY